MGWTVEFFRHKSAIWKGRYEKVTKPGETCYAARQAAMWEEFESKATNIFQQTLGRPMGLGGPEELARASR